LQSREATFGEVRFDPGEGDEIRKTRPAVVMSVPEAGRMRLHIVVPITGWQSQFAYYFWMRRILPAAENGLSKESAADTFQITSVSPNRFRRKLGVLPNEELREIASAIALCIGYSS
jgi:mRNA interferase MazF